MAGLIDLELLHASCSLDRTIGGLATTQDLGLGALLVCFLSLPLHQHVLAARVGVVTALSLRG